MKKLSFIFLSLLLLISCISPAMSNDIAYATGGILIASMTDLTNYGHGYQAQSPYYGTPSRVSAQIFTASSTSYADRVEIYAKRNGTTVGNYKLGIKATTNVGGVYYPTGEYLNYVEFNTSFINTAFFAWYGFDFTGSLPQLTSGTKYALSLEFVGTWSNSSNNIQWRGNIADDGVDLYSDGYTVYDITPASLWTLNLYKISTVSQNDLLFRVYGSSANSSNTVIGNFFFARQALDDNWNAYFSVKVDPTPNSWSSVNVTLSASANLSAPIATYQLNKTSDNSTYTFATCSGSQIEQLTGSLTADTRYYYRAKGTIGGIVYYDTIKSFKTLTGTVPPT